MILVYFLALIATLFAGWRAWRRLRYFLHVFQLEGYKPHDFRQWLLDRAGRVVVRLSHKLAVAELILAFIGFYYWSAFWTAVIILPLWAITFASSRLYRSDREKKPLAYTPRMQRLTVAAATLAALPVLYGLFVWADYGLSELFYVLLGFFVADILGPFWVLLAAFLMRPVEKSIQEGFKRRARQHLRERPDLTIIGITGSYGKTSTKFVIEEILQQRYSVLASPGSYNTPMGLCIVINNMLKREHQVLIVEMGIRHPGDMKELCGVVRPDIAVETSVGMAHLESMGTVQNIAREKGDLLECLDGDGITVLNADDELVAAMSERAPGKILRVSVEGRPGADITASDVTYDRDGARFTVRDDTGEERAFKTQLLGRHNVLNILLGIAVGRAMDLRLRQMAYAIERLEPVRHRLQLRKEGPITIIDDAFNSNPVGARNAVEILGQFRDGRRVIVTPGMIELGDRQFEENKRLGEHIAANVDLALLVGDQQTRPIQEGLKARNFPPDKLKVVASLHEAQTILKTYLRPGDTVLYENDLPDQYAE